MEFVIGLLIGLVVGGCVGILAAALAVTAARADEATARMLAEELPDD